MKNSKLLIFILSVILLIVVIKCVRGVMPREGFAPKTVSTDDFYNMPPTNALSSDSDYQQLISKFVYNPGSLHGYLPKGLKYGDKITHSRLKKDSDGSQWSGDDEKYLIMTDKSDFQTFFNRIAFNFGVLKREIDKLNKLHNDFASKTGLQISARRVFSSANKSDIDANAKKIKEINDIGIVKKLNSKIDVSKLKTLASASDLQNLSDKIDGFLKKADFNNYKATQQATDNKQNKHRNAFINTQYAGKIAEIEQLIEDSSTGYSSASFLKEADFNNYKEKQETKDSEQNKHRNAFINTQYAGKIAEIEQSIKESSTDVLKEADFNKYKATQQATDNNQDTKIKKNYDDLEKWVKIFETARAKLDFKVKCQDKNGNDNWNVENCPDWLKGKSP